MCRTCYDVYRRLDQLRGKVGRANCRDSGSLSHTDLLSREGSSYTSSAQHLTDAEAGAARLSADLTAMLSSVDARSGKLGIEAGIIWRRRLR